MASTDEAATTNDVTYALYANSFGSNRTYYPNKLEEEPRIRCSILNKVINGLEREINARRVHFISEEFRAKALSAFINHSRPSEYNQALRKLSNLPVARTPDQLKVLKEDRDNAVQGNPLLFSQGTKKFKEYTTIGDIRAGAKNDKFEDRSEYVEKALALLTVPKEDVQERAFKLAKRIDDGIKEKSQSAPEFAKDIELLTATYTSEGFEIPKELGEYRAALQEEEDVPVAATATDTPSVPDAQLVDSDSGEETLPKPNMSLLEEAIAKASSVSNAAKSTLDVTKAEKFIVDNTAVPLGEDAKFIEIQGAGKKKNVVAIWPIIDTILKEEIRVTSTFKEKLKNYWDDLKETSRPKRAAAYKAIMELPVDDKYYKRRVENAKASHDIDPVDLNQNLEDTGDDEDEQQAGEEPAEVQDFEEPAEPQQAGTEPAAAEAPPVIEQPEPEDEVKRELLEEIRAANPDLSTETLDYLKTLPAQKITRWKDFREKLIEAGLLVNAANDEADDNADDGFFGLRNNFINALGTEGFNIENLQDLQQLLDGQEKPVFQAALTTILSRPEDIYAFDQNFLNDAIQNQQAAGNLVEQANQEVQPDVEAAAADALGGDGNPDPNPPADPPAEAKPSVSGSQPTTGTGSDSEKLNYVKRVHPDVIEIFFGQSSFPDWDTELEKKLMSMEMSEARRIEIMEDVIAEYGTKIFIKARKGSSKEELNELVQLQFCVMRNLQRGPRAKTANVKVSDLVRMQSLASGNGAPTIPQPQPAAPGAQPPADPLVAQQAANIQAAPKPMITEARGEITNAQVQTFSEAKFISDYSRMQMSRNLNSGVKLEYPNPPRRVFNNQTPQSVNFPGRAAGLGKRKVTGFSSGKF